MFINFTQEPYVTFHQLRNVQCLHIRAAVLACSNMSSAMTVIFTAKLSSDLLRETATAVGSSLN